MLSVYCQKFYFCLKIFSNFVNFSIYFELLAVNIYGYSLVGHIIFSPDVNVLALLPTGCSILFHKPMAAAAFI